MAEIFGDVYDFIHPTPVSLKQLAAMAVSLQICRCEVNKHRESNTLEEFDPMVMSKRLSEKTILPDLPSTITNLIEEHVRRFTLSLEGWLNVHYCAGFNFHYDHANYILKDFDDFVCDYDGTVDCQRTAERMMHSNRLSETVKFKIACMYFFEDDIRRIWPSVCKESNTSDIDISPGLYYWNCYLRNDLNKILLRHGNNGSVDEIMFDKCSNNIFNADNKRSVLYFWNRIPLESRLPKACYLFYCHKKTFVRFLLRKLDDVELVDFVNENGVELMHSLLVNLAYDESYILPTWMYIKNIMNESQLEDLVADMLRSEFMGFDKNCYRAREVGNWVYYCFEILNNVPCDLKLSIIRNVLSNNNDVFVKAESIPIPLDLDPDTFLEPIQPWRTIEFLLGILSYVTFEERNAFWQNYWHYLIKRTRAKDLRRIMETCFKNEDEIAQFKENMMAESEILRKVCEPLLTSKEKFFKELYELIRFCYTDTEAAIRFAQKILWPLFLAEGSCDMCHIINAFKELSEFIDDVHQNADLSADFKNQLMSSPMFQHRLAYLTCAGPYWDRNKIVALVVTFVSSEQIMQQFKTAMIDVFKDRLNGNISMAHRLMGQTAFKKFLLWCLGSQEEFTKFELFCNSKFERMY